MKKFLLQILKCFFAGILALTILSIICFFYSNSPIGIADETNSSIHKSYPNSYSFYMKEGFAVKKTDANGYYNESAAQAENPEILIMGSSHIEALQIPTEKTIGSILNQKYKTYCLGVSGQYIDACVSRLPTAIATYHPSKYVILETTGDPLSIEDLNKSIIEYGMPNTDSPIYSRLSPQLREFYRLFRTYIPCAMELYKGLDLWATAETRTAETSTENQNNQEISFEDESYKELLDTFIEKAAEAVKPSGAKLIIISRKGGNLEKDGSYTIPESSQTYVKELKEICEKHDVILLDVSSDFKNLYEQEHIIAYGFSNTSVGFGHLNKYGHRTIANAVLRYIEENETEEK